MSFTRITVDPNRMGGVPCIRGLRIPVSTVVDMVADRMNEEEILGAFYGQVEFRRGPKGWSRASRPS